MLPGTHCDDYEPLLAAYALGERDPETISRLEAHLAVCPHCRDRLNQCLQVARVLPLSAPDAVPSPDTRARLLQRVAAEQTGARRRWRLPRWSVPRLWRRVALVLNAVVLVALLVWNIQLHQAQQERLARQRQAWAAVSQILNDPGVRGFRLTSDTDALPASGTLLFTPGKSLGCLVVEHMPPLPPDQTYQLWLLRDEQRVSGGTFRVDENGSGWLLVQHTQPLDSFDRMGITTEPLGGSPGPTSDRVIGGML